MAFIADHFRKTGLKQQEPVKVRFVDGNDDDSDHNSTEDTDSSSEYSGIKRGNRLIDWISDAVLHCTSRNHYTVATERLYSILLYSQKV